MQGNKLWSLAVAGSLLYGCAMTGGAGRFQTVDLNGDLSPSTIARYEKEYQWLHEKGQCGGSMTTLEYTNLWPLGLLLYWQRGVVMRMETEGGPLYMIQNAYGFGPLCLLYVGDSHATFDAQGRRLSGMSTHSYVLGHLGMVHQSDHILANGIKQEMTAMHLMHHLINLHEMDGHAEVSLLTGPNPVGTASHGGHGGH